MPLNVRSLADFPPMLPLAMKRLATRLLLLALLLAVVALWAGAYVFNADPVRGCSYSAGECGDPAPGNFPAAPGN